MKKLILLPFAIMFMAFSANAQIFWVENFESGSTSGLSVSAYTGPNGTWTNNVLGSEGSYYNEWYVSCAEQGHVTGVCGDICGGATSGTGASLHLGANASLVGDDGAAYNSGGLCSAGICVNTNRRAESPTINCTGKYGITISFYYIEGGDSSTDNATLWYYNGTTWDSLFDTYKTPTCGGSSSGQGKWQHFSYSLPASANNNANVKIGFKWINNDDGTGNDPSFAVDSVSLSTSGSSAPVASFTVNDTAVCQDSCITFISTTTGSVDSIRWSIPGTGVTITGPHSDTMVACFANAGYYTVKLYAYSGGVADSSMHTIHIHQSPTPVITQIGDILSVSGTYSSIQWYEGGAIISGATGPTYHVSGAGTYAVIVDSGGCQGESAPLHVLGVVNISANSTQYSVTDKPGSDAFTLYASAILDADMQVNIFDATGRLLLHDSWPAGTDKKQFNINNMATGLYIIRLTNSYNSAVLKWLKQ